MGLENQGGEGASSNLRTLLGTLLSGVASIFSASVTKKSQATEENVGLTGEQGANQTADMVTTVVQDKVEHAVSGIVGGGVLGSVAGDVVGAMAGAVAGEFVDVVVDTVTGVVEEKNDAAQKDVSLGTAISFDDASEIYAYVRQVLRHFEGNTATPCIPELGKSSATISTGLDLGQHDVASLKEMGIAEDIIAILKPLLKKNAQSAKKILKKQAVRLTEEQNAAVEKAIIVHYMATTADAYDAALEKNADFLGERGAKWSPEMPFVPCRFAMLPKEMQAVLVSVLFQHGSPHAVPRFWSFATQGQWQNLVAELRDFYSEPTVLSVRRNEEADMILLGMGRVMQGLRVA